MGWRARSPGIPCLRIQRWPPERQRADAARLGREPGFQATAEQTAHEEQGPAAKRRQQIDWRIGVHRSDGQAGLKNALSYLQSTGKFFVVEDMKSEGKTA